MAARENPASNKHTRRFAGAASERQDFPSRRVKEDFALMQHLANSTSVVQGFGHELPKPAKFALKVGAQAVEPFRRTLKLHFASAVEPASSWPGRQLFRQAIVRVDETSWTTERRVLLRNAASSPLLRLLGVFSVAFIAFLLVSPSAAAQSQEMGWWYGNPSPDSRRVVRTNQYPLGRRSRELENERGSRAEHNAADKLGDKPAGPLFAILSLSDQHISVYNGSGLVSRSRVSTGMPGHPTPMGIFTIIGRERHHRSNIYSGAPMPFMQRLTWSGIALHLGVVPGYPASHGCIRLPPGSAERMWGLTKIGERVVISPYEITPSVLAHPLLPVPKMQPFLVNLAETTTTTAAGVWPANIGPMGSPKLLNPYEIAQALKRSAASDMASATKALTAHNKRKQPASEVIRRAFGELRAAVAARAEAEAKLAVRTEALATKRGIRERAQAGAEKAAAESHLAETGKRVEAALDSPAFTSQEGREALEAERELIELRAMLTKAQRAAREAQRRLLPVSVFVSRMESKVYVRQGLAPVLETPISIRDPETPLGTHVYIATSADGASLRWSVVSFPVLSKSAGQTNGGRQRGTREAAGSRTRPLERRAGSGTYRPAAKCLGGCF